MVQILEKELGVRAEIEYLPVQPVDVPHTHADISKARMLLGYCPKVDISIGLKHFCSSLRKLQASM